MRPEALMITADTAGYRLVREAMEHGLRLIGEESTPRAERLRANRDFSAFMERELPRLIERFQDEGKREG
jgi:hypothetical protein